jgi:hypothetical protein
MSLARSGAYLATWFNVLNPFSKLFIDLSQLSRIRDASKLF